MHPEKAGVYFFMDESYMRRAIELAKRGFGFTNPNPLVGAVIVKDGRVIGEGWHEYYGGLHAERNAIKNAVEDTSGADMYVTLEPCSHHGKQPPCTEAVAAAGIKRVFIGSSDPNPLVSGKGVAYLRERGIEVLTDVLKDECDEMNEIFFHYITQKRPYVIMKTAMTADGKTATRTGNSKWITNELSRGNVHLTRKRVAAIMVGINTVIADDPMLNCRCFNPKNPTRIICDSRLRISEQSQIVQTAKDIPTIVATTVNDSGKIARLGELGVDVIITDGERVDLRRLMAELGRRGIDSVLVEGGAEIHSSLLEYGLVDKLQVYVAPKIIGGNAAPSVVGGAGVDVMDDAYMFEKPMVTMFGDDILIEYSKKRDNKCLPE